MKKRQVYKCLICGNEIEILEVGGATLMCCAKPMDLMESKTADEGLEKHVPVLEKTEYGYKVKVGEVEHPMGEDHWIRWVELHTKDRVYRKELASTDKPEVEFHCDLDEVTARIECNLHGVWKSK